MPTLMKNLVNSSAQYSLSVLVIAENIKFLLNVILWLLSYTADLQVLFDV